MLLTEGLEEPLKFLLNLSPSRMTVFIVLIVFLRVCSSIRCIQPRLTIYVSQQQALNQQTPKPGGGGEGGAAPVQLSPLLGFPVSLKRENTLAREKRDLGRKTNTLFVTEVVKVLLLQHIPDI